MFRRCIVLDLDKHLLLPVNQPALTARLLYVSGVIGLLLQHQCTFARLTIGLPLIRKDESPCPFGLTLFLQPLLTE